MNTTPGPVPMHRARKSQPLISASTARDAWPPAKPAVICRCQAHKYPYGHTASFMGLPKRKRALREVNVTSKTSNRSRRMNLYPQSNQAYDEKGGRAATVGSRLSSHRQQRRNFTTCQQGHRPPGKVLQLWNPHGHEDHGDQLLQHNREMSTNLMNSKCPVVDNNRNGKHDLHNRDIGHRVHWGSLDHRICLSTTTEK